MKDLDDLSDSVLVAGVRLAERAPYYFWRYIVYSQKAPVFDEKSVPYGEVSAT
jgi:hypothetical protein